MMVRSRIRFMDVTRSFAMTVGLGSSSRCNYLTLTITSGSAVRTDRTIMMLLTRIVRTASRKSVAMKADWMVSGGTLPRCSVPGGVTVTQMRVVRSASMMHALGKFILCLVSTVASMANTLAVSFRVRSIVTALSDLTLVKSLCRGTSDLSTRVVIVVMARVPRWAFSSRGVVMRAVVGDSVRFMVMLEVCF